MIFSIIIAFFVMGFVRIIFGKQPLLNQILIGIALSSSTMFVCMTIYYTLTR